MWGKVALANRTPEAIDDQQWESLEITISTPPGAGRMVVGLAVQNQVNEKDTIWFDDVKIIKLK